MLVTGGNGLFLTSLQFTDKLKPTTIFSEKEEESSEKRNQRTTVRD